MQKASICTIRWRVFEKRSLFCMMRMSQIGNKRFWQELSNMLSLDLWIVNAHSSLSFILIIHINARLYKI